MLVLWTNLKGVPEAFPGPNLRFPRKLDLRSAKRYRTIYPDNGIYIFNILYFNKNDNDVR